MREFFYLWMWRTPAIIFVALPFILAIFGPFGTYSDLTFLPRLVYWAALVFSIGAIMWVFNSVVLNATITWPKSKTARIILAAGCAALPSMAIVQLLHTLMRPSLPEPDTLGMLRLWLEIWVLGSVISLFEDLRLTMLKTQSSLDERTAQQPQGFVSMTAPEDTAQNDTAENVAAPAQNARMSRLHRRLPPEHQNPPAAIVSLSMQDHYVEITTQMGQQLVLMRFSDAIAELDDLSGLRIHRSHWVGEHHMVGLRRAGNRTMLQLSDGRELPVSQTYKAAVQDALSRRLLEREGISAP